MKKRKIKVAPHQVPKFIPNPAWEGSEEQEEEFARLANDLDDYYTMKPDACGSKLSDDGSWIMVKRPPMTEYTVPPLSMWYAMPEIRSDPAGNPRHLARILTPKGDLFLWPAEYVTVKDITVYWEFPEDHVRIHILGGEEVDPDALFYIRSRGISKKDALKMLLGTVKTQNVAFVTVHPAYANILCCPTFMPLPERLAFTEEWPT